MEDLRDLIIDEEFQNLIPPLTVEEFNQLEQNIIDDDEVRDPLIVWTDQNIIVDGHNRYKVLLEHPNIPYRVIEKPFESRQDVILWMLANQLGRRNLNDTQRSILLGQTYEIRKAQRILPRDEGGKFRSRPSADIRSILAEEYNTTVADVERSGRFVRGLKEVEEVYPGTTKKIKSGELEVTKKDVMALTSMEGEEKRQAIDDIVAGKRIYKPLESDSRHVEEKEAYTIADFKSELMRKISALEKGLELTCVLTHKECLETEEGKEALRDVLLSMTEVIKKYFKLCD